MERGEVKSKKKQTLYRLLMSVRKFVPKLFPVEESKVAKSVAVKAPPAGSTALETMLYMVRLLESCYGQPCY